MNRIKLDIVKYAKMLNSKKLSALRSGNISIRYKNGFFITPSGKKYSLLRISDIIFVSLDGKFNKKNGIPSSEWKFHQDIYLNKKKEANAIVHAHSTNATAVSTHKRGIPPFHYMVAMAGGSDIKCAKYATFGTRTLSKNILLALKNRKACLISNHGQIVFEENISLQYITSLKLGNPKILSLKEMKKVLSKAKNYKRG
jgi:L-fuculose-phosphate aldolase